MQQKYGDLLEQAVNAHEENGLTIDAIIQRMIDSWALLRQQNTICVELPARADAVLHLAGMLRNLRDFAGCSLLDLGSSCGQSVHILAEALGVQGYGIDMNSVSIHYANLVAAFLQRNGSLNSPCTFATGDFLLAGFDEENNPYCQL